jgi:hypothetical protein
MLQVVVLAAFVVSVRRRFLPVALEECKISTTAELQIRRRQKRWLAPSPKRCQPPFSPSLIVPSRFLAGFIGRSLTVPGTFPGKVAGTF